MKTNVFWGVVGAILVIWLVLLYFVIFDGKMTTYAGKVDRLDKLVRKVEKYAKMPAEELPTSDLLEKTENGYARWQKNVDDAQRFYQDRDDAFESRGTNRDLGTWQAAYKVAFSALKESYREYAGLEEDAEIPFREIKDLSDPTAIAEYQKLWNVQRTLIERTMEFGGRVRKVVLKTGRDVKGAEASESFDRIRSELQCSLPPRRHVGFVDALLSDKVINFEIQRLLMNKDREGVQYDLVSSLETWNDQEAAEEPRLRIVLVADALDWKTPVPDEPGDDKKGR